MRTLFLHLGPAKSGSTYVQTALELSRSRLSEQGIDYPSIQANAMVAEGDSLFGNYACLLDRLAEPEGGSQDLLISGESLHGYLQDPDTLFLLDRLRHEAGFDRMSCLLLPRSPVHHASATHQQRVKHTRVAETVSTYFARYRSPEESAHLVGELERLGAEAHLRSYDAARGRLLEVFEEWLGVPAGLLIHPSVPVVNRSLTRGELELQRAVNAAMGPRAPQLVTTMVERLPDLAPHRELPPVGEQVAMIERLRPALDELNRRLPDGEELSLAPVEPEQAPDMFAFTREQLTMLADEVAQAIERRDPFGRYRQTLLWRWAALATRLARGSRPRRERPSLERSVLRLTATRGARWRGIEAALLLVVASSVRRLLPMKVWVRVVGRPTLTSPELPIPTRLEGRDLEAAHAVVSASTRLPFQTSCLDQAVAGSLYLRRRRLGSSVVIGLNRADPADTSHAWLVAESGAVIVGGRAMGLHVPVTEFSWPARR